MKLYHVTTRYIRDSELANDFIDDMMYCEENNIPIKYRKQKYSGRDVQITRGDSLQFPSGQPSWNHNMGDYPVAGDLFVDNYFPDEDLFIL